MIDDLRGVKVFRRNTVEIQVVNNSFDTIKL